MPSSVFVAASRIKDLLGPGRLYKGTQLLQMKALSLSNKDPVNHLKNM